MTKLFEDLKQKNSSQTVQDEAGKRLKAIVDEVEKMKRKMEDKHRQIEGTPLPNEQCARADAVNRVSSVFPELQDKIQQLIKRKEERAADVSKMVEQVESLRKDIARRAEEYITCTA